MGDDMARFQGVDGIVVETFDDVDVVFPAAGGRRGSAAEEAWQATAILDAAVFEQGTVTRLDLAPSRGPVARARRGRRGAGAAKPVSIEVPVGDAQTAVMLVESEGVFHWRFPDDAPDAFPAGRDPRRGAGGRRVLRFRIGDAHLRPAAARRGDFTDFIEDAIFDRVRAYVVRFVAKRAVQGLRAYLESSVVEGLVDMTRGVESWKAASIAPPAWPKDRPGRLLLGVHGTFSSTLGSFGALAVTDAGKSFLTDARKRYDAIVGYDHSTLVADPLQNAEAIVRALDALEPPDGTIVDMFAFSRGGLVARILAEGLLATRLPKLALGRIVFIGCANSGTQLAEPENWKALLDLFTNLASAAGDAIGYLGHDVAGKLVSESVKTLNGLILAIIDAAVDPKDVAGVAAMRPNSELIAKLNAPAPEIAAPPAYFALGSHFQPRLFGASGGVAPSRGISEKLGLTLANFAVDGIMREANDLVVDNAAMHGFGARADRLKATELWGENIVVYHLNYFHQPEIVAALRGFLLTDPAVATPVVRTVPTFKASDTAASAIARRTEIEASPAVAILREDMGVEPFVYVRASDVVIAAAEKSAGGATLLQALDLHEKDRSPSGDVLPPEIDANGFALTANGALIGVVPPLGALAPSARVAKIRAAEPSGKLLPPVSPIHKMIRRGGPLDTELVAKQAPNISFWADKMEPAADAPKAPEPAPQPEPVDCKFLAEMPPAPPIGGRTPLSVTLSRKDIAAAAGAIHAGGHALVPAATILTIEVTPVANCEVLSQSRIDAPVPEDAPAVYDFIVSGVGEGPAEIWIDIRDGMRRLARLVLQPNFVSVAKLQAVASTQAEPDLPNVTLRIYDIARGKDDFSLLFEFESRELGVFLQKETPAFNFSREKYVRTLYDKLDKTWISSKRKLNQFMLDLATYGAELYAAITPRDIQEALWEHRERIGGIQVISQEPFIPWELLQLVEPGKDPLPDAPFLAEYGLVRWIANAGFPPAAMRLREGAAYHVAPKYENPARQLQSAQQERDMLEAVLKAVAAPTESTALVEFLRRNRFDLLHFACHGEVDDNDVFDASLELQDQYDAESRAYITDRLTVRQVRSYANLRTQLPDRPIVFVNACETGQSGKGLVGPGGGMAQAFVQKGAGVAVAALWSVGDDTAFSFSRTFYERLLAGDSLTRATLAARTAARDALDPSWLAYTVYGHPYARVRRE
jgi:hypothetical protein